MASCITSMWSGSVCPQARLTVNQQSQTDTTVTLSWAIEYVTHSGYVAYTDGNGREWEVYIDGALVDDGTFDINNKTGRTIGSGTKTVNKATSSRNVSFTVKFRFGVTWSGVYCGWREASGSISIGAKTSYTVSFNANGGSGAPSSQTKWHGTALTLSSTKPTRTGYSFQGWATSSSATSAAYSAGGSYTSNAAATLYAVWKANTYTVSFNANGGTGAPSSQTKTYGKTLTLSSTKPTRTNYNFLGWGTSASSTTASYAAGGSYTTNAAITLYAVWELAYIKPRISGLTVSRCNSDGTADDTGTYAKVSFEWATDRSVGGISVAWESDTDADSQAIAVSGTSGTVSHVVGSGSISADSTCMVTVTVLDSGGSSSVSTTLNGTAFAIDFLAGGKGVAIGKPAEDEGFVCAMDHIQLGNSYSFYSGAAGGSTGYLLMARMQITAAYVDAPITFVLSRRQSVSPMTVYVKFKGADSTDPELDTITYEGSNYGAFLVKSATSVWDLYVQKSHAWCNVTVNSWFSSGTVRDGMEITSPGTHVASVPAGLVGYYRATPAKLDSLLDHIYPVNSIYISYSHTSPAELFGGTWTRITNRFLWATTASGTIGGTGGEQTHKLTVAELPSHSHGFLDFWNTANGSTVRACPAINGDGAGLSGSGSNSRGKTANTGSGTAHNNMPPYIQVSVWRRTE